MSLNNFIPQVWAARIQRSLDKRFVFAQERVVNRDYEGDITQAGDTVHIHSIGDPTIFDYTKNTDLPDPETLQDSRISMTIDQAKAFNFQVDDVDKAQQKPKVMDRAMQRAAYKFSDVADQYVAGIMVAGVDPANVVGSADDPIVGPLSEQDPKGAYEILVDLSVALNEAEAPAEDRFVILPPWFEGVLRKDPRFINNDAASQAAGQPLLNGSIGRAAGFEILISNNTPTSAAPVGAANQNPRYRIVAGHEIATSFADQINKVEAYRPEARFADAVKGLHLYGSDVTEPKALAMAWVTQS